MEMSLGTGTQAGTTNPTVTQGYKRTEVGVIPEDWGIFRLSTFVKHHRAGIYKKKALYGQGSNIIGVSYLYDIDSVNGQIFDRVPLSEEELSEYSLVPNDLLYGESSLVREGIARTVYVTDHGAGTAFAWHTRRYAVNPIYINAEYLYYYLQTRTARSYMLGVCIQTALTGINTKEYFACPITLPSLPEQSEIATALSDADNLITSLDTLIAKKQAIKQAAMQQLLTGKTRLPGFEREWERKRLGDVLKIRHGRSQRGIVAADGKYPILASGGEIGRTNTYLYERPSVLIGRKGTIDNPQYASSPFWTVDTLFYSEISEGVSAKFIFYKFCMVNWRSYNEASGVPSLNACTIENIEVSLPEEKEQRAIATVLSDMDAEITALEQRRAKTKAIKQGMMQELLTGKTRLVTPQQVALT